MVGIGIGIGIGIGTRLGAGGAEPVVDSGPYDLAIQEEFATGGGTSLVVTLRQAPTTGNLLVCCYGVRRPVANLLGPGEGWTAAVTRQSSTTCSAGIWYKISDGTETEITATHNAAAASQSLVVREYPGVSASPLDVTVSNAGPSITSLNFGTTAATAQADELAVALLFTTATTPLRLSSWANDFEEVLSPSINAPLMHVADKILTATGAVTTTAAWEASNTAAGLIATFKLSAPPTRPAMPVRRLASGQFSAAENSGTTKATRAVAPAAGRVVLCLVGLSHDPGTDDFMTLSPSHSGSMVWTEVDKMFLGGGAAARYVYMFRAMSATDPGSDTVTLNFPEAGMSCWYAFVEVGNVDQSGSHGAGAIAQVKTAQHDPSGVFVDIVQDDVPAAGSTMVGIVLHGDNDRHLHEAGYHIIQEGTCGSDKSQQVSAFWKSSGDQTTHVEWVTNIHAIAIVAEIKAAA